MVIDEHVVPERVNSAGLGCSDPAHSRGRPVFTMALEPMEYPAGGCFSVLDHSVTV